MELYGKVLGEHEGMKKLMADVIIAIMVMAVGNRFWSGAKK